MAYTCKGICITHPERTRKTNGNLHVKIYGSGVKRCQMCGEFFRTEGFRCPCCGVKLRGRCRNNLGRKERTNTVARIE